MEREREASLLDKENLALYKLSSTEPHDQNCKWGNAPINYSKSIKLQDFP
jgi:hypothetical protein